jgi:NAD(P)H-hydrate repair Nnr-like enzyme with NAD(P)H-hydrate dehydratase domain
MAIATNSNTPFTVITPHEGEAKKLGFEITGVGNKLALARKEAAIAMAKKLHVIVVLKGQNTVIASPDGRSVIDRNGGSELATAGTGDILAGLIGSMLASWKPENLVETTQVVAKAVKLHGLAGALAAKSFAPVVATDVLDALAKVSVKFN